MPRNNPLEQLWQDIQFGLRVLSKNLAITVVSVLTLAVGMGATTAIFSVIYGVMLRPLPFPEPSRLVQLQLLAENKQRLSSFNASHFIFLKSHSQSFASMAVFQPRGFNLLANDKAERLVGLQVSSEYFNTIGITPVLGRNFAPDDDTGRNGNVAILSYGLWKRNFDQNHDPLGKTIELDGQRFNIIGVMPANFKPVFDSDIWTSLDLSREQLSEGLNLGIIARVRNDLSVTQATAEMSVLTPSFRQEKLDTGMQKFRLSVLSLQDALAFDVHTHFLVLAGAAVFVLLIACANVANLLLARGTARNAEIAVRMAIGASRARIVRQLLTESLLLSFLGTGLGLLAAHWGLRSILSLASSSIPRVDDIHLDGWSLAFAFLVAFLTGVLFGIAPVLQARKMNVHVALKQSGAKSTSDPSRGRSRAVLVIGEIALSLILLTGAGLLLQTIRNLWQVDPGFDSKRVLSAEFWFTGSRYGSSTEAARFGNTIIDRLEKLPGVESAAIVAAGLPFERGGNMGGKVEGGDISTDYRVITAGYFHTLGIGVLPGRDFSSSDNEKSLQVAIANSSFMRKYFEGKQIVGQRVTLDRERQIIGVVPDVKSYIGKPAPPTIFVPLAQGSFELIRSFESIFPNHIVVRTGSDPARFTAVIERQLRGSDPTVPFGKVSTLEEVRSTSIVPQRLLALVTELFAALALLLATMGIYSVTSFTIAQRTTEIGMRMALGAQRRDIFRLLFVDNVSLSLVGLGIGLAGSIILTRVLSSVLFQVAATDPFTLIVVSITLLVVALTAGFLPARNAMRIDPLTAIRAE